MFIHLAIYALHIMAGVYVTVKVNFSNLKFIFSFFLCADFRIYILKTFNQTYSSIISSKTLSKFLLAVFEQFFDPAIKPKVKLSWCVLCCSYNCENFNQICFYPFELSNYGPCLYAKISGRKIIVVSCI